MDRNDAETKIRELVRLREDLKAIENHAKRTMHGTGVTGDRARCTWLAALEAALEPHPERTTIQDTIDELQALLDHDSEAQRLADFLNAQAAARQSDPTPRTGPPDNASDRRSHTMKTTKRRTPSSFYHAIVAVSFALPLLGLIGNLILGHSANAGIETANTRQSATYR